MRIREVISRKGDAVVTCQPGTTVGELLGLLAEHGIGAVVVSGDGRAVDGIVSERDVVRRLHERGAAVLTAPVQEVMTAAVHTTSPDTEVAELAGAMTEGRFRHVPLVEDGALVGIVSIGDVVRSRIEALAAERDHLQAYIQQ